jgi:hypothetical protein
MQDPTHSNAKPNADNPKGDSFPPIPKGNADNETAKTPGNKKAADNPQSTQHNSSGNHTNRVIVWLTAGLVVCAVIQATIYYCTMDQIKRQADAADSLSVLTKHSVAVAESSIAISRETAYRSNALSERIATTQNQFAKIDVRAYVVFNDTFAFSRPTVNKVIKHKMWYTNVGKTPAHGITAITFGVVDYQQDYQRMFETKFRKVTDASLKMVPGKILGAGQSSGTWWGGNPWIFTPEDSVAIFEGGKVFIVFFKLTYFDIFGDRHFTEAFGVTKYGDRCTIINSNSD